MERADLRKKSLSWFRTLSNETKIALKEKHYKDVDIKYSDQWGYQFSFLQIEQMYLKEKQLS